MDDSNNHINTFTTEPLPTPPIPILLDQIQSALGDLNEEIDALTQKLGPVLSKAPTHDEAAKPRPGSIGTSEVAQRMDDQILWINRLTMQVNTLKHDLEI